MRLDNLTLSSNKYDYLPDDGKRKSPSPATGTSGHEYALYPVIQLHIASAFARQVAESDKYYERLKCGSIMDKVEIILRTTTSSGKVTEQLLTEFNIRQPASEAGIILQFSGLSIDPIQYQIANSHFLRTAGPHFPDSPGHIKRTAWDISRAEGTPPH